MRILLAEDDASQAESIKTWLEMDGYSVDWVERGDHAILAIEQHQYDCVLLDRGLPHAFFDDQEVCQDGELICVKWPVIFYQPCQQSQQKLKAYEQKNDTGHPPNVLSGDPGTGLGNQNGNR